MHTSYAFYWNCENIRRKRSMPSAGSSQDTTGDYCIVVIISHPEWISAIIFEFYAVR